MEASSTAHVSTPAEATTPSAYDDDSRHFAITASQVPKPAASAMPHQAANMSDGTAKDMKSIGTRFHEDCHETDLPSPKLRSSRLFKGKGKEAVPVQMEKKKPLRLLDLPVDILKDIVKEVTHTNDLTSLALCHSALHNLTIPHIYSRFDIVWPDSSTHAEPRSGVDALTYGLATLVMAEEVFGEAPGQRQYSQQQNQNNRFVKSGHGKASETAIKRRRGNHYAHFTRKFSLGNGPADWVQEYLITKEGGKMLGTLVALAVARMRSLETFVWDMPTGILRDVWLALSSLGDRDDGQPCRLERLWVRWHDNSSADSGNAIPPPPPPPLNTTLPPGLGNASSASTNLPPPISYAAAMDRVEQPSFSVLPSLKSLSVLDVDELAYLDEMAVVIGRSIKKLRELRVGIARHAVSRDWVTVWEGESLQQVHSDHPTYGSVLLGEKRLGGVLGVLTGFVHDMRKRKESSLDVLPDRTRKVSQPPTAPQHLPLAGSSQAESSLSMPTPISPELDRQPAPHLEDPESIISTSGITSFQSLLPDAMATELSRKWDGQPDTVPTWTSLESSPASSPDVEADDTAPTDAVVTEDHTAAELAPLPDSPQVTASQNADELLEERETSPLSASESEAHLDGRLNLENLELERVPLSVPVLQSAVDWTRLTSLTLLHCQNHEQFWKTLRRTFAPRSRSPTYPHCRRTPLTPSKKSLRSSASAEEMVYGLSLKKVHTNTVSPALISFLKETLAPNSLEVLFLQEARSYSSSVSIDAIFKGPLKRHRASLKKVLIDSSEKGADGLPTTSSRWRRWMLNREILSFVTSGKMSCLRELGMAIDYRDWHFFLQHLPSLHHLRSLYIPFLADHVHGTNVDPRELALQIVDIVALRPEVELCYMGIATKCFEILENKRDFPESHLNLSTGIVEDANGSDDEDEEEDGEEAEDDEEADDDAAEEAAAAEDTESEATSDDSESDSDVESQEGKNMARLRLREILFYDDKVAIFKARHGRL